MCDGTASASRPVTHEPRCFVRSVRIAATVRPPFPHYADSASTISPRRGLNRDPSCATPRSRRTTATSVDNDRIRTRACGFLSPRGCRGAGPGGPPRGPSPRTRLAARSSDRAQSPVVADRVHAHLEITAVTSARPPLDRLRSLQRHDVEPRSRIALLRARRAAGRHSRHRAQTATVGRRGWRAEPGLSPPGDVGCIEASSGDSGEGPGRAGHAFAGQERRAGAETSAPTRRPQVGPLRPMRSDKQYGSGRRVACHYNPPTTRPWRARGCGRCGSLPPLSLSATPSCTEPVSPGSQAGARRHAVRVELDARSQDDRAPHLATNAPGSRGRGGRATAVLQPHGAA